MKTKFHIRFHVDKAVHNVASVTQVWLICNNMHSWIFYFKKNYFLFKQNKKWEIIVLLLKCHKDSRLVTKRCINDRNFKEKGIIKRFCFLIKIIKTKHNFLKIVFYSLWNIIWYKRRKKNTEIEKMNKISNSLIIIEKIFVFVFLFFSCCFFPWYHKNNKIDWLC